MAGMDSFLVLVGKLGPIEQVIWCEPRELITDDHQSLFLLFDRDAKANLLRAFKKSANSDEACICDSPAQLKEYPVRMSVCVLPVNRQFLVFAAECRQPFHLDEVHEELSSAIRFMKVIRSLMGRRAAIGAAQPAGEQGEMIKTLMSELRDRKRLLEEAHDKLTTINRDLNNRLVKDSLTGLVSRYQYRSEIEYVVEQNPGSSGIFVFIDIDDFKSVNDRYGHATGDKYLIEFAERLKSLPRPDTVRMRIAGDEFGLFVFGLKDCGKPVMDELWGTIRQHVLYGPIHAGGRNLPLSVSAGMSVYRADTEDIYELIEFADYAMYAAKRRGKNQYCVYSKAKKE